MRVISVAHSGSFGNLPKNSLAGFKAALAGGADAIELDIWRCASGEAVVFHDRTLKRLAQVKQPISRLTLADLRKVNVGHPISTLREVVGALANINKSGSQPYIFIDIKNWDKPVVNTVVKIIEESCKAGDYTYDRLVIQGISWELLRLAKKLNPKVVTGQSLPPFPLPASTVLRLARYSGAEMVNVYHRFLSPKLIMRTHEAGLLVNAWTINNEADMRRLLEAGVDFVTTDRLDILAELLRKHEVSGRY